ncbi:radical SAM protein [Roseateles sp. BYS180W]|uniref:Radical SAM protein n=1 Tax=Roseateles rivi TaxID=3299028 RepID=A0ABW7FWZ5_9BURK
MTELPKVQHSKIHFMPRLVPPDAAEAKALKRERTRQAVARLSAITAQRPELGERLNRVVSFARSVRVSEYHLTNACNIRCQGCWFFEYGHERETREMTDLTQLQAFVQQEVSQRRVNTAILIGGEPVLVPERIAVFKEHMNNVTISSNGLKRLPMEGFENVGVAITLFAGGPLDDELRAIKPNGKRFEGLFETALRNYEGDHRGHYIYALTEGGIAYVEETVRKIRQAGNALTLNYYTDYRADGTAPPPEQTQELLQEALRVQALYPETVMCHPYTIRTLVTGASHWGEFGYAQCPSISVEHPAHAARLLNGNPFLPVFNTWAADMETLKFCCTSGHCEGCRDSQAVISWLLVSMEQFLDSAEQLQTWLEIAEMYWAQYFWSPYHRSVKGQTSAATA